WGDDKALPDAGRPLDVRGRPALRPGADRGACFLPELRGDPQAAFGAFLRPPFRQKGRGRPGGEEKPDQGFPGGHEKESQGSEREIFCPFSQGGFGGLREGGSGGAGASAADGGIRGPLSGEEKAEKPGGFSGSGAPG